MEWLEKLATIQQELIAPKSQYNSFGKYNYRSCEDIIKSLKPLMKKLKCFVILTDETVQVGSWVFIKATACFFDYEISRNDPVICANGYAGLDDEKKGQDRAQITGSASSYARKYALNGLFCIDDTKDSDTDEAKRQADNAPAEPAITAETIKAINEMGINIDKLLPYYKVTDIHQMTEKQGKQAVERKKIQLQRKKEATANESGNV